MEIKVGKTRLISCFLYLPNRVQQCFGSVLSLFDFLFQFWGSGSAGSACFGPPGSGSISD
jgi:hypothetical protein